MNEMKLKNKVVLVTGGSRGIGKTIAKKFAENGAQIVITSKNKNRLKNTEKEIKNCFSVAGDVRNDKDVKNVIDKTVKKFKKIDVLVNNVGVLPEMKKLHKISSTHLNSQEEA